MTGTILKSDVLDLIEKHNNEIDGFIYGELSEKLGAKNGKIRLDQWFKAQELIKEKRFYEKGMDLLKLFRDDGWDVKIDAQSNKLRFYGKI